MTLIALVVVVLAVTAALVYNRIVWRPRQVFWPRVRRRPVHRGDHRAAGDAFGAPVKDARTRNRLRADVV